MNTIKKLYTNQDNTHEIIDYLNDIIKDFDVEIEYENKFTQRIVPVFCKDKQKNRELFKCTQYKSIDKVLIIIRPEYNSHLEGINEKFSFTSLEKLKCFEIDFSKRIPEKYNELREKSNYSISKTNKKIEKKSQYKKLYNELQDRFNKITSTEKDTKVRQRIGQNILREALLKKECQCKICSMSDATFLIASHIKPWRSATDEERLDDDNAFLLCPNHDSLFDKGYISFNDNGEILISDRLSDDTKRLLAISEEIKISISDENKIYLKWHRENIFKAK